MLQPAMGGGGSGLRLNSIESQIGTLGYGQTLSVSDAKFMASVLGINPNRPIFIGGGGDGYTLGFVDSVQSYATTNNDNFYTHYDTSKIDYNIEIAAALGQPVIIVGHSWGADAAFNASVYAISRGINVNLLATMDPVGDSYSSTQYASKVNDIITSSGGTWVDVQATYRDNKTFLSENPLNGDLVARIGGPWPTDAQQVTGSNYHTDNVPHAYFPQMLNVGNVPSMINNIYKAWGR